jgi:hypothetical protein
MQESTTAGVVEDDFDDFDPHALAIGDEDDRARLKEYYRAAWVGKPNEEDFEKAWPTIQARLARVGQAAEEASNVDDVTAPAGEYFLGDPGYAVKPRKAWMHLLESCNYFEKPTGQLPDGTQVIAFSTAYGDGFFADNFGNMYPVDAALIGLVPVTEATEAALAETEATVHPPEQHMTRVRFDEPAPCTRQGRGLLTFGSYQIDTA